MHIKNKLHLALTDAALVLPDAFLLQSEGASARPRLFPLVSGPARSMCSLERNTKRGRKVSRKEGFQKSKKYNIICNIINSVSPQTR